MRALVVEDEGEVADDIARALQAAGFVVDIAADGEDAWFKGNTEDYDVAILDLGLPRIDGLSVLRRWRDDNRLFPVIIVSARNDWTEKVAGIEAGADDYLGKPFEIVELIARVRGLVRRAAGRASSSIRIGNLVLDTHRMSATLRGSTDPTVATGIPFSALRRASGRPRGFGRRARGASVRRGGLGRHQRHRGAGRAAAAQDRSGSHRDAPRLRLFPRR